jgi:hypothetical protein
MAPALPRTAAKPRIIANTGNRPAGGHEGSDCRGGVEMFGAPEPQDRRPASTS